MIPVDFTLMWDALPSWQRGAALGLAALLSGLVVRALARRAWRLAVGLVTAVFVMPLVFTVAAAQAADSGHPGVATAIETAYRVRVEPGQRLGNALLGRGPLRLTPDGFPDPVECWIRPGVPDFRLDCPVPVTPR